jgi:hypothetical protein
MHSHDFFSGVVEFLDHLSEYLAELTAASQSRRRLANRFRVWAEFPNQPVKELFTMGFVLIDDQKVALSIAPVDAKGNPAAVDGAPAWASSDETVLTVAASADGLSATVTAVGKLGAAQISVTADADMGAGTVPIAGVLDVSVVAGQAVSLSISTGTPEAQDPAAPPAIP